MAKGDGVNGPTQPQAPKMDQYSVMHSIMDRLGQAGGSIAPSPDGGFNPGNPPPFIGTGSTAPQFGGGGMMGSPMGGGSGRISPMGMGSASFGPYGNDFTPQSSIAPQSVPEQMRRRMTGTVA